VNFLKKLEKYLEKNTDELQKNINKVHIYLFICILCVIIVFEIILIINMKYITHGDGVKYLLSVISQDFEAVFTLVVPLISTYLLALAGFLSEVITIAYNTFILIFIIFIIIITGLIVYRFLLLKIKNDQSYIHYLWTKRILFYIITYLVTVFLSYYVLHHFKLLHTQVDSAQYMISALIQSEAAIIAILITLTLIAVQQSASLFSPKVIDLFKYGNPDFWIILIIYISSIIYGLGVLKLIDGANSVPSNLESSIFISYSFCIFSLIALIPYMWNTLDLLKPLKMIEILSKKISIINLSNFTGHKSQGIPILETISVYYSCIFPEIKTKSIDADEGPIQPIIDIINRSLINYDYETARQGFEIIQNSIKDIIYKPNIYTWSTVSLAYTKIVVDLTSFAEFIIKKNEEDFGLKILITLNEIQKRAYEQSQKDIMITVAESLKRIQKQSAEQNMQSVVFETLELLKQIRDIEYSSMIDAQIIACDALLEVNQEDIISLSKKADILRNTQIEEACEALDKILEINPNDIETLYKKGCWLFWRLNQAEEAIKVFDKLLEIKPDHFYAFFMSVRILYFSKKYEEALIACYKAIEIDSQNAEVWNQMGCTLDELGRNEEALVAYDKALETNPQYAEVWKNKGVILSNMGRYEEALAAYDKALETNSQYAGVWKNKGVTLSNMDRNEEALAAYDKALETNPQYAEVWKNKGVILSNMDRNEEALAVYDKALETNPQYAEVWMNKGIVLSNMGRYEEALVAYDKALETNPQYAEVWKNKGVTLSNMDRNEEALAAYDKALETNPQYAEVWMNKGIVLSNMGRYEEARIAFESAHKLNPKFEVPSF